MSKQLLLLKTGDVAHAVFERVGDYDRWFVPALRASGVSCKVVQVHRGEALPEGDGLLITGSPLSLTEPAPWMHRLAKTLRQRIEHGTPVLGVCFGHQLLSLAYGMPVVRSPRGREIGTVSVQLTAEGRRSPLFARCPEQFWAQATHEDVPELLPDGATELAGNAHGLQAMSVAPHAFGVQFHPELSPEGMQAVIRARRAALQREGRGVRELEAGVRQTPIGARLLANFLRLLA